MNTHSARRRHMFTTKVGRLAVVAAFNHRAAGDTCAASAGWPRHAVRGLTVVLLAGAGGAHAQALPTLVFDPSSISITSGAAGGSTSSDINALSPTTPGIITDGQLSAELGTSNVVLAASGIINDTANVKVTGGAASSLTFQGTNITLAGSYSMGGGLVFNAAGTASSVTGTLSGSGSVTVTGGAVTFASLGAVSYGGSTTVANGATLSLASPATASLIASTVFNVNGPSTLVIDAINREDIRGTVTFDPVGGGTLDFTGTGNSGGVVMVRGGLTIVATGGAQDRVTSPSGSIGLNFDFNTLTLNTTGPTSSVLVSSFLWNTGNLTKTGPGTAFLTASNQYVGITTLSGGILSVPSLADGGEASNIGQSSNAAGNLVFNGGTLQYTGPIVNTDRLFTLTTGGGTIDASGTGPLNFTDPGAIGFGGTTGARSLTLTGSNAGANTLAASVGDSGGPTSIVKSGPGTWVMTGANTYSGGTSLNQGVLNVPADNTLGAASGPLTFNGGTLQWGAAFNLAESRPISLAQGGGTFDTQAFATTIAQDITGAGGLTKAGAGTLTVLGTNTYSGGTTIDNGTLQVGNGGTSGSIVGDVLDNGTLAFDRSNALTFGGIIAGSGAVSQAGSGVTVLTGDSSYSGGTTISSGTLQLGNGGTSSSIAGDVANNGTLVFDRSGTLTFGGIISGSGAVSQAGSGVTVLTGDSSYSGGTTISSGTLQLGNGGTSGSIVGDVLDNGTLAFDRSNALIFGGVVFGTGALLQMGTGNTVLTANSTYSGPTTVQLGTLIVNGSIRSPVNVLPAGTLAGSGLVNGSVVNQGVVWPGIPVAGNTGYGALTIRGNYSDPQGQVVFNTFLGSDGSPSSRLVLDGGTTSGTSAVVVHVTGASGAETQKDGIRVVQAVNGATTPPDAFALAQEERGGYLDYRLFRGGVDGNAPNDWFLRSNFVVGPPQPEEPPGIPPGNTLPIDPPPSVLPPSVPPPGAYPIIGPELATYGVVQPIARQLGLTTLGTLHERIGDTLTQSAGDTDNSGWSRSGWVRLFGQQIDNRYETFTDARASGYLAGLQAGLDVWRGSFTPGHHDAAGVYFSYGNSEVDIDGLVTNAAATAYTLSHTGALNLKAYTGGAYWTHYGPGGWYVDAVLQGTHYDGDATTQSAMLPGSGSGILTSLEVGYPVLLPLGPNFIVEPQAQIIWQRVALNEANDGLGSVDLGSTSGVTGRLGLRGQWTIDRANGQVWQPYVRTNVWRDSGAQSTTTFGGVDQVPLAQQATRMDLAAGFTAKLDTRMSLYGQFGDQFSISRSASGKREGVWGDIGIRYAW